MNNEKKQEIPSVAFIPQGYHAVIDGNKVIIKKGEEPVSEGLEEAATKYARKQVANPDYPTYNDEYEMVCAFEAGAQWQKKQLIDKVCKWLAKHWRKYVWLTDNDVIHFGHWEHDLKRAMEE